VSDAEATIQIGGSAKAILALVALLVGGNQGYSIATQTGLVGQAAASTASGVTGPRWEARGTVLDSLPREWELQRTNTKETANSVLSLAMAMQSMSDAVQAVSQQQRELSRDLAEHRREDR